MLDDDSDVPLATDLPSKISRPDDGGAMGGESGDGLACVTMTSACFVSLLSSSSDVEESDSASSAA